MTARRSTPAVARTAAAFSRTRARSMATVTCGVAGMIALDRLDGRRSSVYGIGMTPIAFIGLGIMGNPMAGHLLAAGYSLTVNSRTKSRAEPLLSRGAQWADTPAEAAKAADVVFIC